MSKALRSLAVVAAGAVGLAFAGSAAAAYSPRIVVLNLTGDQTQIEVSQDPTDDPTARVVIYAPLGAAAVLNQPVRTQIGQVTASVIAADLGGIALPLEGRVEVADPAQFAAPPANLCTGRRHEAVWILVLSASGQELRVPVYVDRTAGAEASFSSLKLTICLPPPDVPAGTPGRATFGAKLVRATMTLNGVISTAQSGGGDVRWSGIFTPYTPGRGTPNAAGTVQAQSITRITGNVRLTSKLITSGKGRKRRTSVRLSGSVPTAGARTRVQLLVGTRRVAEVTADAQGRFSKTLAISRTTSFRARALVPQADVTSNGCTSVGVTLPCTRVIRTAFTVTSRTVKVTVRKAR